jgi:hypothetical protein
MQPCRIYVKAFQPFESRVGVNTVLALKFEYDPERVEQIKQILRGEKARLGVSIPVGGWLKPHGCWWVERWVWPSVKRQLAAVGCTFVEDANVGECTEAEAPRNRPPGRTRGRSVTEEQVKQVYQSLVREYHPNRGGSWDAMSAISRAYEELKKLMRVR